MVALALFILSSTGDTLPLWGIYRGIAPYDVYKEALWRLGLDPSYADQDELLIDVNPWGVSDSFPYPPFLFPFPMYPIQEDTLRSLLYYWASMHSNWGEATGGLWYPNKWPPTPRMMDTLMKGRVRDSVNKNSDAKGIMYWNEPDHAMWRVQDIQSYNI